MTPQHMEILNMEADRGTQVSLIRRAHPATWTLATQRFACRGLQGWHKNLHQGARCLPQENEKLLRLGHGTHTVNPARAEKNQERADRTQAHVERVASWNPAGDGTQAPHPSPEVAAPLEQSAHNRSCRH